MRLIQTMIKLVKEYKKVMEQFYFLMVEVTMKWQNGNTIESNEDDNFQGSLGICSYIELLCAPILHDPLENSHAEWQLERG